MKFGIGSSLLVRLPKGRRPILKLVRFCRHVYPPKRVRAGGRYASLVASRPFSLRSVGVVGSGPASSFVDAMRYALCVGKE